MYALICYRPDIIAELAILIASTIRGYRKLSTKKPIGSGVVITPHLMVNPAPSTQDTYKVSAPNV